MDPVTFPTISPYVLTDVSRPRVRSRAVTGVGYLFEPPGPSATKVLPAVVVLPDLDGPSAACEVAHAVQLARRGYVVLVVDAFAARGAGRLDARRRLVRVTEAMMLADAFAGLRLAAEHPRVDPGRVAALGFGIGGMVAVLAAYRQIRDLYVADGLRFAAHASYYGCPAPRLDRCRTTGAPVLLLVGEVDEAVSIRRTRDIAADLRCGGSSATVRVYAEAAHAWDGDEAEALRPDPGLGQLRLLVSEESRIHDQWSGIELRGALSRRLALWMARARRPVLVQRNPKAKAGSDEDLTRFLADTVGEPATLVRARGASARADWRTLRK